MVATLDSQTVVLRESLTPMSRIQGGLHSHCQGMCVCVCVCPYGATCRRASLFSVCREGHRRSDEFPIGMDPQKHTQPTLTYPLSRLALSYSSIPSVGGGGRDLQGPQHQPALSARASLHPKSRGRVGGFAMNLLTSVDACWLAIGSQGRSEVPMGLFHRTWHAGGLGSMPSCGTWVHHIRRIL